MKNLTVIINSLVIILSLILLMVNDSYDESLLQLVVLLAVIPILTFFLSNSRIEGLKGQYLRTSYVFLIGFLIVFFQYNLDLTVKNVTVANSVFASTSSICPAAIMSLIGLCSYVIGTNSGMQNRNVNIIQKKEPISKRYLMVQKYLFVFFVLVYLYYNATNILSGGFIYNEETMAENAGSLSNYSAVMILVMIFSILCSNVYNLKLRNEKVTVFKFVRMNGLLFNIPLIAYLTFVFMTGDRGPILTTVLSYTITYVVACERKIRLVTLAAVVIIGGTLLTIIGNVRKETNLLTIQEMVSYRKNRDVKSVLPSTLELAGSYNTFTYSVDRIPSTHGYFYGAMKLRDLGYSVPFLYRLAPFVYSKKEYENGTTSYCTYLIQGVNRTYGNGSSLLADIYLDFGVIGIIIIMFFLGKFIVRIDFELFFGNNLYWLMIGVVFFSYSIYLSRATLVTPLYYIVPSYIILYCRKFVK